MSRTRPDCFEAASLAALNGIRHGFFGRRGGISKGPFESLNVGVRNADDPANVAENRARIAARLDHPGTPIATVRQVHGRACRTIDAPGGDDPGVEADALVSRTPGTVIGVTTADCVPILFADAAAGVIGAAHAGWRGALDGIIEATVSSMIAAGAAAGGIRAAIGPAIALESYEIGDEFEARFASEDPSAARFFHTVPGGARHFDLKGYCGHRLARAGVGDVEILPFDTCVDEQRFFSYRRATKRGERAFGLQLAAIALGR